MCAMELRVKRYATELEFRADVSVMAKRGWSVQAQSAAVHQGKVDMGKTLGKAMLSPIAAVAAGRSRKADTTEMIVTWERPEEYAGKTASLVFVSPGKRAVEVTKALKDITGIALAESFRVVTAARKGAPQTLKSNLLVADAEEIAERLEQLGATVEVVVADLPRETAGPGAASATDGADVVAKLKQLAELRDAGILSTEEFDTKKKELLAKF